VAPPPEPHSIWPRHIGPVPIPRWRSFRLRVMVVVLLVAVLPMGVVVVSHWLDSNVQDTMRSNLAEAAEEMVALQDANGVARRHGVWIRVLDAQGNIAAEANHEAAPLALTDVFFGPDGAPTLQAADDAQGPLHARAEVVLARTQGSTTHCALTPLGQLVVCAHARALPNGGVVHVTESSRRAVRALHDVRYQLLKLLLAVLPVGVLLAWWLGWRMIRPLDHLRRQAMQLVPQARAKALQLGRDDEFGDLAHAFNSLLSALDERRKANEAWVADLTHEFKNPVAAIRAAAESLANGPPDPVRLARLARVLNDSSQRLDALVTQLLELARAEGGMKNEARTEVDLAQMARGIAGTLKAVEPFKDVTVSVDGRWSVCVEGVPARLESALRNLMDNAASFAGPGGWVRVHMDIVGNDAVVTVSDSGPGISPEDLPRVFERFYTTRGERRGTGLGLALTRAVVEAHGGRIQVTSPPAHGAVFEFTLPAAP
jgi:signal transduction histidine kinase